MSKFLLRNYLPKGEPTRAWTARTYNRILKCREMASDGNDFEQELTVLERALLVCDISEEDAAEQAAIHKRERSIKLQVGREAAEKAMKDV